MNGYKIGLAISIALFVMIPIQFIFCILDDNWIWALILQFSMWLTVYNIIDGLEGYFRHRKRRVYS